MFFCHQVLLAKADTMFAGARLCRQCIFLAAPLDWARDAGLFRADEAFAAGMDMLEVLRRERCPYIESPSVQNRNET